MAIENFAIRTYEDLKTISNKAEKFFEDIGFPNSGLLEFKVSKEVYDSIANYMWNRNLTYTNLKEYNEMSMNISKVRIRIKIS